MSWRITFTGADPRGIGDGVAVPVTFELVPDGMFVSVGRRVDIVSGTTDVAISNNDVQALRRAINAWADWLEASR